jgi:DNA-binding IscR family transcriptional regulator
MNKNFKEAYESVCKENVRLRADLEAEEMALKKVVAEVNELTRRFADDSNKKRHESLREENIRLRDSFEKLQQAYTRTVNKANSLQLRNEKLQREKDELAHQLVEENDTVYIKNCDNLTFNL